MLTLLPDPTAFCGVITYSVELLGELGVPETAQVDCERESPEGSEGLTLHEVIAPPEFVGVPVVPAESKVIPYVEAE